MSCSTITSELPSATIDGQRGIDLAHHDRRQPEADLVAQQQSRVRHQRAADRHHLLLAARQRRAGLRCGARPARETAGRRAPASTALAGRAGRRSGDFPRPRARETAAAPPAPARCRGATTAWAGSSPIGSPRTRWHRGAARISAGDALEQRALAGAVGADHRHHLARRDLQRHAEQRLEVAVEGVERAHRQQRLRHRPESPCRSRAPPAT